MKATISWSNVMLVDTLSTNGTSVGKKLNITCSNGTPFREIVFAFVPFREIVELYFVLLAIQSNFEGIYSFLCNCVGTALLSSSI